MLIKGFVTISVALFIGILCIPLVYAQDSAENSLEGYKPPPLFGVPRFPEKDTQPKVVPNKKPAAIQAQQSDNKRPIGAPRISKEIVLDKKAVPLPLRRPNKTISKPVVEITEPPVAAKPVEELPPVITETAPKKSQGVVKGPKTMPAVKADSVAVEAIEGEVNNAPTDMLDRVQKQVDAPKEPLAIDKSIRPYTALDINKPHIIIFEPEAVVLNAEQFDVINNAVLPTLVNNNLKLNIISYASPAGDGFSSDRRFSLSRALAVRGALMDKGFDPSKINVRALGSETNKQPFDRIELEFIKP